MKVKYSAGQENGQREMAGRGKTAMAGQGRAGQGRADKPGSFRTERAWPEPRNAGYNQARVAWNGGWSKLLDRNRQGHGGITTGPGQGGCRRIRTWQYLQPRGKGRTKQ